MRISSYKLISLAVPESSDADLLVRFVAGRDEAAFEELVRRHGPAVLRVCRRLVGPAQADDAFQAVFLVLACRAKAVRKAASVGSWLVGVAGRVARQMRQQLSRRQATSFGGQGETADPSQPPPDSHFAITELAAALDEELTRLPDALRAPVVLCLVEGRTQEQAVAELGGSLRTLRRRLDRAKGLLRLRLERRGVVPAVVVALIGNMQNSTAVPPELVRCTVRGVFEFLAGGFAVRSTPASIAKGVVANMTTFKAAVLVPVAALVLVGLGAVWAQDKPGKNQLDPFQQKPGDNWQGKDPKTPGDNQHIEEYYRHLAELEIEKRKAHRTKNFLVYAPTPTMARALASEAEYQRELLAKQWFGKELPDWDEPCQIRYTETITTPKGTSVISYGKQKDGWPGLVKSQILINDEFLPALTNELPRQVMRMVVNSYFGTVIPRWADEGMSIAAQPVNAQAEQDELCRNLLREGRGMRLREFLPIRPRMNNAPKDIMTLSAAQGHSVVRFLIQQKVTVGAPILKEHPQLARPFQSVSNGQQQFVVFLLLGIEKNTAESWNNAAKSVYGFESVDALEKAWLDYLQKPESVMKPSAKLPSATPNPKDTNLIPPTTLPGGPQSQ
jgi:RNA polymerase sigma factor (sigma-70 family)